MAGVRGARRGRADDGRAACARKARGALAGSPLNIAGETAVETENSERAGAGAGAALGIGRLSRMAIPAWAVGHNKGVVVAAGAAVVGVDTVLATTTGGAVGGSLVASAGVG